MSLEDVELTLQGVQKLIVIFRLCIQLDKPLHETLELNQNGVIPVKVIGFTVLLVPSLDCENTRLIKILVESRQHRGS